MSMSAAAVMVLKAFLAHPDTEQYGFGLMKVTGVKSGSLYPILTRLERAGWVTARDEEIGVRNEGRPPRRLYRLTLEGQKEGASAVANFYRVLGPRPSWIPGIQES